MSLVEVGQRVKIKSIGIKGRVDYLDYPNLFNDWMSPVQVILDKPYDDTGHLMYRAGLRDIVKLKAKKTYRQEVETFLDWLKNY